MASKSQIKLRNNSGRRLHGRACGVIGVDHSSSAVLCYAAMRTALFHLEAQREGLAPEPVPELVVCSGQSTQKPLCANCPTRKQHNRHSV
jgi:hypothetical protein